MLHKRRSLGARKVSPPQPTCMTDDQKSTYLANLRNNRPTRPGGARPLPGKNTITNEEQIQAPFRSGSSLSFRHEEDGEGGSKRYSILNSGSLRSLESLKGRPLVQAPAAHPSSRDVRTSGPLVQRPGELRYRESMSRELEKQEAHSLRQALEQMDHADEETRLYAAAQKEAADLVWKHLNPRSAEDEKAAAYRNPDLQPMQQTSSSVRKDTQSHRSQRGILEQSAFEGEATRQYYGKEGFNLSKRGSRNDDKPQETAGSHSGRRRSSGKRVTSNGSSKGVFRNPDDQIYEEPEEAETRAASVLIEQELPLRSRPRNSVLRGSRPLPGKPHPTSLPESTKFDQFDIHKNPPSQSRNAAYRANLSESREATPEVETPKGRAMEIRSDEIRAATSMKRKDRSPKLPTPTAVSDRPGRPIVSFDPGWRPGQESPKTSLDVGRPAASSITPRPTKHQSAPTVPTITLAEEDSNPTIRISDGDTAASSVSVLDAPSVPTITLPEDTETKDHNVPTINLPDAAPSRPLPQITVGPATKPHFRPLPTHTQSLPSRPSSTQTTRTNRVPWLSRGPATPGATVMCNACQLPIAGRIVTASGSNQAGPRARFHPECFTCFHCSTGLECVSFYPEPESAREERLQQDESGDPAEWRFFCHLDYHDLFSPRCASCKTPIEGAVVIAAGKSWHEGHFFCAECGDPFSSTSPFVEDRGYAYCVGCHTKRTSARCRACKRQILDEVTVEALGGKWHEECFRCDECGGDFGDDGRFFVREIEIELTEKEKRKGVVTKKVEERAVCHGCEELRLRRDEAFL